ncbi:MAG TPA: HEXXH motif-containing putative peptide modification protein [Umezawaea sp.]|nr:HEXXH motif-containing putative peptide modification protein [Umezawaea sp.]
MTRPHSLSGADFAALARGRGGVGAVRALVAARRSRTLLLLRFVVGADPSARQAFEVLAEAQRIAPAEVERVLDHPAVSAWATRTAVALSRGDGARSAELAHVAAAAALRAGLDVALDFPPSDGFSLPSLGYVDRPVHGTVPVDRLEWVPTPEIAVGGGVVFALDRWSGVPGALLVDHRIDLERWREGITGGWELLVRRHPEVAEEFREAVAVLTPLRSAAGGMSSATQADAFGCVFLSLGPDARSVAVTLAHELQHTKLVALMDLFPLLRPDPDERFYAPWRDDPRPLAGLLHGTYAHLGVAGFWRRERDHDEGGHVEFARWRAAALDATATMLGSGRLTEIGRDFVTGMAEVLAGWADEPVPATALERARALADEHRRLATGR